MTGADRHEEIRKRQEALKKLFEEGGPRLEAYLKEAAREGIGSAYMEMDEAAQELGEAMNRGHQEGMSVEEIQKLLDELAHDAEAWGGRLPISIRMNVQHVRNIIEGAA